VKVINSDALRDASGAALDDPWSTFRDICGQATSLADEFLAKLGTLKATDDDGKALKTLHSRKLRVSSLQWRVCGQIGRL
jgi:hypothetical protein